MYRILLMEDDTAQRDLVCHVLGPLGFEVVGAETGEAGIQALQEHEFQAILVDLRMPKLSGEFVIQWILANRPQWRERVLVITGDLLSPGLDAFLGAVEVPMLAKPYLLNDLVRAVRKIVGASEVRASGNVSL